MRAAVHEESKGFSGRLVDIILYRCGFSVEKKRKITNEDGSIEHVKDVEPLSHALQNVGTVMDVLERMFDSCELYLTGKNNFRFQLATIKPYKGNRSPFNRPAHYDDIKLFLIDKYDAAVVDGKEADDELGLRQRDDTCIVSTDKDLDQIPGYHYNWVQDRSYKIDEIEGLRVFYRQMLTGDSTDHIPGIEGIGKVKASRAIDGLSKEFAMWSAVKRLWNEHYPNGYNDKSVGDVLSEIGSLLWIQRKEREQWQPPTT